MQLDKVMLLSNSETKMEHMKEHGQAVGEELVLVDLKILLI
jgi:hypothetical protein